MSNENTIYVKPRKGLIVRQPERNGEALPARGAKVPRTAYWLRRLRDGDVEKPSAGKSTTSSASKPAGGSKKKES